MKIPLAERLDRMSRWLECRNDRPLVGFTLGSYYPLHRYPGGVKDIPNGPVRPDDIVVSKFLDDTDRLHEMHEQAGGDFVFSAAPFIGMPWLEAALGCGVIADHHTGSTRSTPPNTVDVPEFCESNPWVAKMLEFIPALARRSAGRYPVGVTLMRGISDLLSALYGGEAFVLRMCDEPEEVHRVVEKLTRFWIAFGRCLIDRLPLFHGGTGAMLYGLWCPGKMILLQEDAAALLSPALYEQFIYPADREIARVFENCMIHLHPTRFIPTKYLVNSQLAGIELHIDHDGPRAEALADHYRLILERKPLLVWGDLTEADLEFVLTQLPRPGLAVILVADSVEDAHRMWDKAMGYA
jgi:Uroporphyrinogen decarboxylase (URO-D)